VKAPNRVGLALVGPSQHLFAHWEAARKLGKPLDVAICVGAPPVITYTAPAKVPAGVDELAVAGALAGEAIPVVRCKTVDVSVPADAEFVIEGRLNTELFEREGPFGEFYGYVHPPEFARFMEITCITHRRDAVWVSLVSQLAPSESSVLRRLSTEPMFLSHLRDAMNIKSVRHVSLPEDMLSVRRLAVIQFDGSQHTDQVRRALLGAATFVATGAKLVVAVDADVDPDNLTAVWWAVATRSKPHRDVTILPGFEMGKTPPFQLDAEGQILRGPACDDSVMLIDATMKSAMPPVSLPKRPYMERALQLWQELGLPELNLRAPWYGVSLGHWGEQLDADAEAAARGDYHALGERVRQRRKPVV
jgi:4-hydroxy-3-polyprenylbenzoate decarboxylase